MIQAKPFPKPQLPTPLCLRCTSTSVSRSKGPCTHSSTRAWPGTSISDSLVSDLLSFLGLSHLQISSVTLESRHDVQNLFRPSIRPATTRSGADCSSVYHHTRSVQSTQGDQSARHVFVTARNDDHSVQPVSTGSGFHLIRDEVSGLKRIRHWDQQCLIRGSPTSSCSHANTIRYTDSTELIANKTSFMNRLFDFLAESE
jgi:hypothetical protein